MDAVTSMFHMALSQKRGSEKKQSIREYTRCTRPEISKPRDVSTVTVVQLYIWNLGWEN